MYNVLDYIFAFILEHIFITSLFIVGLFILFIKFFIWLLSYIISEVIARVYIRLHKEYNLTIDFIHSCNNNDELDDFDNN